MSENIVIVEVKGGVADITSGDAILIDWDNGIDYDTAVNTINQILESSMDGPAQMKFIVEIAQGFLDGN